MTYRRFDQQLLVLFHRGDQVMAGLAELCRQEGIEGGTFFGLGAVDRAELAVYDLDAKEYITQVAEGVFEVTNISGTIAMDGDSPLVHAHMTLSDQEMRAWGGHVMEARVSGVVELHIQQLPRLDKSRDDYTGLKIFEL